MTVCAGVGDFVPVVESLMPSTTRFNLQISGMYESDPATVSRRMINLVSNFFGNRLNVVYQHRVGNDHVFAVTVNKWDKVDE